MESPEHGVLQPSIQQQPEPLLIHLLHRRSVWNNSNNDHYGECCVQLQHSPRSVPCVRMYCTCIANFIKMELQVHGVLQPSIRQLSEPLLIHLLRLLVSVEHCNDEYCDSTHVTPTLTQIGPLCQKVLHLLCQHHPIMESPVHGALQPSIHQLSEQLLIHLLRLQVSAVQLLQ